MPNEIVPPHGVMEGKGAYNRHAKLPAGGASLAMPLLEAAARKIELGDDDHSIVIADYGSSQGKNSMIPMQVAIAGLRQRIGPDRPISVFHIDQPSNDFNTLFGVLDADPDRYTQNDPAVFPAAIGRSFYESVLPPESVHLGWCSYAAVWLSKIPTLIPGHFVSLRTTGSSREQFDRQGARDWEAFLSLRAKELRRGGRLVVVLPAIGDDGVSGFENIMDQANAALADMVTNGELRAEEREQMVIGAHPRRTRDLMAPFGEGGGFHDLTVDGFQMSSLQDVARGDYDNDGDKNALAIKHALFFRSIFVPSLASSLESVRSGDTEALRVFGDRLESALKRRLARQPVPMHSFVQTMVLAKQA